MRFMHQLVWPLLALVLVTIVVAQDSTSPVATSTTNQASSTTSTGIATHTIQVGPKSDPHQYVPTNITANVGDVVVFEFYPTNHSVVKADYLSPCVPAKLPFFYSGAFDDFNLRDGQLVGPVSNSDRVKKSCSFIKIADFFPTQAPTWSVVVNDTEV